MITLSFIIAAVFSFIVGQKSVNFLDRTVSKALKEENLKLEQVNADLLVRLENAVKGSPTKSSIKQQFTQEELVVIRNLIHPDKHKNSAKANEMFVKVNDLIK
jgi:hypothetical protein